MMASNASKLLGLTFLWSIKQTNGCLIIACLYMKIKGMIHKNILSGE